MRQSLAAYRATGAEVARPYYLLLLAEVYEKAEQLDEGLSVLAEALDTANKTGEQWVGAELYRLKGDLILQEARVSGYQRQATNPQTPSSKSQAEEEAEVCFLNAIEIACKQQAKSLELRAAMSLARLWQHQGKTREAHRLLSEIYGWFTEGFDTKDLQEAKALLDELAEGQ